MGQLPFASGFEPSGHDVCVVEFKVFVARDFPDVVFDGDVGVGQIPLASGFEPSGHVVCVVGVDGDVGVGHLPLASGFEPSGHVVCVVDGDAGSHITGTATTTYIAVVASSCCCLSFTITVLVLFHCSRFLTSSTITAVATAELHQGPSCFFANVQIYIIACNKSNCWE